MMAKQNSNNYLRPTAIKGADNAELNLARAHKMANEIEGSMRRQSERFNAPVDVDNDTNPEP